MCSKIVNSILQKVKKVENVNSILQKFMRCFILIKGITYLKNRLNHYKMVTLKEGFQIWIVKNLALMH